MINIKQIADNADMIVCGYAFTLANNGVQVISLDRPDHAALMSRDGEMLESTMDDIEYEIVLDHYHKNSMFLGDQYA